MAIRPPTSEWACLTNHRRRRRPQPSYVVSRLDAFAELARARGVPRLASTSSSVSNYDRLLALKDKFDPTNVFWLNQNIVPTAN